MSGAYLRIDDRPVESRRASGWFDAYGEVLSHLSDAAIVLDSSGRVCCWNAGAKRLFLLSKAEVEGRRVDEVLQIRWSLEEEERDALAALRSNGTWQGVNIYILQNGLELHVESTVDLIRDARGESLGLVAILRDVTERERMEAALRESEHRLQLAQRVAQMGWFVWDIQNDCSVSSDEAQALHGLVAGTFRGGFNDWKKFVHPDDLADVEQGMTDSLREGGEHSHTHRVVWPDGSIHWLRTRLRVSVDENGQPERMVGVMLDVTDLKEAEEMARLTCQDLEKRVARRTAALEEGVEQMEAFVYSISHDFRAPLRAMEGFAYAVLADDGDRLSPSSRDALERIRRAAQRLDALVNDLVDYTRLERAELSGAPVDVGAAIDGALRTLRKTIDQKQAVVLVERPLPEAWGDPATVEVVMAQLLSNALKFVEENTPPRIRIWGEAQGNVVRFSIQDNGIGIAREYQERIFRVFERLHGMDEYAGTGIGLAVVRKAVQRMRGRVGVESQPQCGSCFWFELPKPNAEPGLGAS